MSRPSAVETLSLRAVALGQGQGPMVLRIRYKIDAADFEEPVLGFIETDFIHRIVAHLFRTVEIIDGIYCVVRR